MPRVDAILFVEEPPEFEYRNGLFHVVYEVGSMRVERVMRPSVFMLSLRRAAECARAHKFAGASILPFERPEEEAATGGH